jgi:hypothetical protein
VFGLGFGVTQNVTQTVMYDRVPESAYGASSALWNLAYDGGMGLGAAGFGVLACTPGTRSRSFGSRPSWSPRSGHPARRRDQDTCRRPFGLIRPLTSSLTTRHEPSPSSSIITLCCVPATQRG